jgi:hypothetical protein
LPRERAGEKKTEMGVGVCWREGISRDAHLWLRARVVCWPAGRTRQRFRRRREGTHPGRTLRAFASAVLHERPPAHHHRRRRRLHRHLSTLCVFWVFFLVFSPFPWKISTATATEPRLSAWLLQACDARATGSHAHSPASELRDRVTHAAPLLFRRCACIPRVCSGHPRNSTRAKANP